MALRALLDELLGAEVQQHTVTFGSRKKVLHFRQITDEEAKTVFYVKPDSESSEDYGRETARRLIAKSLCTPEGEAAGTYEEACELRENVLWAIFYYAAITNNLTVAEDVAGAAEAESGAGGEGADRPNG